MQCFGKTYNWNNQLNSWMKNSFQNVQVETPKRKKKMGLKRTSTVHLARKNGQYEAWFTSNILMENLYQEDL